MKTESLRFGCSCGARWDGENICHCASCHATFSSVTYFDLHRVGPWERRACLTPLEMATLTRKNGQPLFSQKQHAGALVWHGPPMTAAQLATRRG